MVISEGWVCLKSEVPMYGRPTRPPCMRPHQSLIDGLIEASREVTCTRPVGAYRGYSKLRTRTAPRVVLCSEA